MSNDKQKRNAAGRDASKKRHPPRDNSPKSSGYQTNKSHGTERKGGGQTKK